jgi:hypothetical protein
MAALDFGMALSRGMLPKSEKAQQDLLNLAGGRNIFKSEDWWNKAVDKQIKEGYRTVESQNKEFLMPTGEYQPGKKETSTSYGRMIMGQFSPVTGFGGMPYQPSYSPLFGYGGGISARTSVSYKAPEGAVFTVDPKTKEKQYTSRFYDVYGSTREDYTAGELKDIEVAAKAGASRAKQETATSEAAQRRLRRGTGGLVAKALVPGAEGIDTGLPALGQTGLGLGTSMLGKGFTL